jgi:rhomboid protease GluP
MTQDEIPSPEDFLPTPRPQPSGFSVFPKSGSAWVANILFAMCVFASLWHWKSPLRTMESYFVASREAVFDKGEYWRLLSALGGHGDMMHFLHNAPIMWFFAWILNAYFGWWIAFIISLLIGVVSNATTLWWYEPQVRLLGASGMIYGMVSLWLTLYVFFDRKGEWTKRVVRSLGFSLMVFFPQTYEGNVSYLAHASGFFWGIFFGFLCIPIVKKSAPVFTDAYYQPGLAEALPSDNH